jgi:site-specific DNA-cytosine methylase
MIITHNLQRRSTDRPALKENKNAGGSGHLSKADGKTYCLDIGNTQAVEIVGGDFRYDEGFRWRDGGKTGTLCTNAESYVKIDYNNLNPNQEKKFNPNCDSKKHNTLTLAIGRAGSSSEYMDSISKIANLTSNIRRLTPVECERLQTVKDNYTNHVSDSQRYKMLGNGWTVDVIAHILSYIK